MLHQLSLSVLTSSACHCTDRKAAYTGQNRSGRGVTLPFEVPNDLARFDTLTTR